MIRPLWFGQALPVPDHQAFARLPGGPLNTPSLFSDNFHSFCKIYIFGNQGVWNKSSRVMMGSSEVLDSHNLDPEISWNVFTNNVMYTEDQFQQLLHLCKIKPQSHFLGARERVQPEYMKLVLHLSVFDCYECHVGGVKSRLDT